MSMMITPMLAATGPLPADSAKRTYEVRWDGFRALVRVAPAAWRSRAATATTRRASEHIGPILGVGVQAILVMMMFKPGD